MLGRCEALRRCLNGICRLGRLRGLLVPSASADPFQYKFYLYMFLFMFIMLAFGPSLFMLVECWWSLHVLPQPLPHCYCQNEPLPQAART